MKTALILIALTVAATYRFTGAKWHKPVVGVDPNSEAPRDRVKGIGAAVAVMLGARPRDMAPTLPPKPGVSEKVSPIA